MGAAEGESAGAWALLRAVGVVQRSFRCRLGRLMLRGLRQRREAREAAALLAAAVAVQRGWRCRLSRLFLRVLRERHAARLAAEAAELARVAKLRREAEEALAALTLQNCLRRKRARHALARCVMSPNSCSAGSAVSVGHAAQLPFQQPWPLAGSAATQKPPNNDSTMTAFLAS